MTRANEIKIKIHNSVFVLENRTQCINQNMIDKIIREVFVTELACMCLMLALVSELRYFLQSGPISLKRVFLPPFIH